ncbi:MAG: heme lyase CcmF/NrfE family subunit [Rickettsiaceae bacterium]|nr:heme lyase CcmF/NrfE family subunit [Rickettsiaceae bacterium]
MTTSVIGIVGFYLLISSLVCAFGSIALKNKAKFVCFYTGSFAQILSFIMLVIGFVVSDFNIKNVFLNSSLILPLIYKISAAWASHEGSILLWLALISLISAIYIRSARFSSEAIDFAVMIIAFIQILFISFIIFTSNPFEVFSFAPTNGMGLNPMLQDMALAIHPPLLYLGNVSYVTLFVSGCLLLYKPEEKTQILLLAKRFSSFALTALSAGIGLGSWWAYRELGWGGFWFFDPVENISLLPWLSGIALHHFLIISTRTGNYLRWTIMLSLCSFLLVIYGTFIVRSGIISSIHSFAFSPERGFYILSICVILNLLCFMWFVIRQKYLPKGASYPNLYERMMFIGNILWIASLLSIAIALIYQIYCSFVLNIEIVIDPNYFTTIFVPIFIPILLLASITPLVARRNNFPLLIKIAFSATVTYLLSWFVDFGIISCAISFSAIYLMTQTSVFVFAGTKNIRQYSLFLGHFGFGLLALTISLNNLLSKEIDFKGKVGDQISSENFQITLENVKFTDGENYYRQVAAFAIQYKNNGKVVLKPENRLYKIEKTLSQEVDIYSFLFYDFYAVLSRVDKDIFHAKIHYQPLISFIWLSILMISSGFFMLLIGRQRKV